ncbi:kinase-like domain-containing protein [Pholiota molesta]|nr:kinase-like domain-containing protein [Pholiota molesta]
MVYCSGCSASFPNLTGNRCGRCKTFSPKPKENWRMCTLCGDLYEFLDKAICVKCQVDQDKADNSGAAIHHAMSNSVNPRTHSNHGTPVYTNPYINNTIAHTPDDSDEWRRREAERITTSIGNSHLSAVARANPTVKVANAKFKYKAPTVSRAVAKYNIMIKNIVHRNSPRTKVTCYDPTIIPVEEGYLWTDIQEDIRIFLDNIYGEHFNHRIYSSKDFSLRYQNSNTALSEFEESAVFAVIWNDTMKNIGLCITEKAAKVRTLELIAIVNYPVIKSMVDDEDVEDEFATKGRKSIKRKALNTGFNPSTSVDGRSKQMQMRLEEKKIGTGKTKEAFKLKIGDSNISYAGKRFYYIGDNNGRAGVSLEDNVKNLREELVRQKVAQQALIKFDEQIKSNKINAYNLKVADAFLLTVTEGQDRGLAWIVDPLLESSATIKFSGTNEAGYNGDLMGMTCDAFAHFSLYDSSGTCVFVDIQGIQGKDRSSGRSQGANTLTLFDLMAHSKDQAMGLGDKGTEGIDEFKRQHTCNSICKELQLPDISQEDEAQAPVEPADNKLEYITKPNDGANKKTPEDYNSQTILELFLEAIVPCYTFRALMKIGCGTAGACEWTSARPHVTCRLREVRVQMSSEPCGSRPPYTSMAAAQTPDEKYRCKNIDVRLWRDTNRFWVEAVCLYSRFEDHRDKFVGHGVEWGERFHRR